MDGFFSRIRVLLLPWLHLSPAGPIPFVRNFTYKEIKRATHGFCTIIGSGSHGAVYKAHFSDGLVATVRELRDFQQEKDAFCREVQLLWCLHHRHLVTFRGFSAGQYRFLIFEYMENGSLKDHLHDPLKTPLDWRTRLQIAIDVAAALEYLLFFCEPPIYHISINSSNVLLDENFVAKLSDVGFLGASRSPILESDVTCSIWCAASRTRNWSIIGQRRFGLS
ncbi:protein kinase superfamily protein isoform X2 [Tasmannia lanceolata]|uniref:protein kinase superfamily protein isoform X2 n=1 Tax=Tasmannia lanceolata TaxID=3420 RepID=UPI0040632765